MTDGPTLYFDFDDVLCETALGCLDVVEQEFGKRIPFDDLIYFDLEKSLRLNQDEHRHLMSILHQPKFLLDVEPMEGAGEGLRSLKERGFQITIVTGRPPITHDLCTEWLARHQFPFDGMLFVNKYNRDAHEVDGIPFLSVKEIAAMDFHLAVEDSPTTVEYLAEHSSIPIIVLDRPWNASIRHLEGSRQNLVRYGSWAEIVEHPGLRGT